MVKPGGILIIDHRNYDYILETGRAPQGKNIYYQVRGSGLRRRHAMAAPTEGMPPPQQTAFMYECFRKVSVSQHGDVTSCFEI